MKRTISSVLALAMVAALLAIFAGAASAQTDTGKGQITAVNGVIGSTVSVVADDGNGTAYDLGVNLGDAGIGTPTTVEPGDYTITFNDGTSDFASYQLNVTPVSAWNVVSGYGDPSVSGANNATAYPVNLDETRPAAVVFANSSAVTVTVDPNVGEIPQGYQNGIWTPASYVITTPGGASTTADLAGLPDTSYTDVIAVGDDTTVAQATVTITDLAALKASLEPSGPSQVAVPNVVGQTEADANTAITGVGLVAAQTQAADDTVPAGSVISQDPAPGTMVDAGTNVNIVVSTGPEVPATVPVPDVAGQTAADAQAALEAAGFTVTSVEQSSMDVEAGLVIETNPSAGTEVAPATEVRMLVSSGAAEITVPDFVGMTTDEATKSAEDAGLTITFVEDAENPDPDGIIVSQNPTAGSMAEGGSEVVAQLAPRLGEPWVILTVNGNGLVTATGINFQPGSTVDLSLVNADKTAIATVQSNGSWTKTADLSERQGDSELLLVTGTAADGSAYEATFKIPAIGASTDQPTEAVTNDSGGVPVWLWIVLGLLIVAIVALGFKMFGGGDSTDGSNDSTDGGDTPPTAILPTTDSN